MCDRHRHIGGNTAKKLDDRPREKAIPKAPERPQLKAVQEVKKSCKLTTEEIKDKIRRILDAQFGSSTYFDDERVRNVVSNLECSDCTKVSNCSGPIMEKIMENRKEIVAVLPGVLITKISEKREEQLTEQELTPILEQLFKDRPNLEKDMTFAIARSSEFLTGFYATSAKEPAPKIPVQSPTHLGGDEKHRGREASVAAKKPESAPVTAPATTIIDAEVVEAEIVELQAPEIKPKPEVDLKDIEARLRKKIQGAVSQKTSGSRLNNDELLSITVKLLPQGCDGAVVEKAMVFSRRIMDEIELTFFAQSLAKTLPEAKPAEVVPAQKIEPVVPPAAVKSVETPLTKPEDKKTGGLLGRFMAFVSGIGQKPVAEQAVSPEKSVAVKLAGTVVVPKAQPAVKQEKQAVQPEKPAATVVTEAPKAPKIKESLEKTDLRSILTDLKSRESTLRKGERGKDERKAFYRNLASQLVERLKIKSTGETAKDRELMKKELLKTFSEQELRSIGPEWFFK